MSRAGTTAMNQARKLVNSNTLGPIARGLIAAEDELAKRDTKAAELATVLEEIILGYDQFEKDGDTEPLDSAIGTAKEAVK